MNKFQSILLQFKQFLFKRITNKSIGIFLLSFLVCSMLYHNDRSYRFYEDKINPSITKTIGADPLLWLNGRLSKVDIGGGIIKTFHPLKDSDYVDFQIEAEQIEKLNSLLKVPAVKNKWSQVKKKWVPIVLNVNSQQFKAKIKFHGKDIVHYQNNKFSYSIKLEEKEQFINNSDRFKLIKGEQANPTIIAINKLAKSFGLISAHGSMKTLRINKHFIGDYYFVEDIHDAFLEREFGITNYSIISSTSDMTRKETDHVTSNDFFTGHIEKEKDPLHAQALNQYKILCDHIENKNIAKVKEMFDSKYIGKYLGLASVFNDIHFMSGDNLKLIYDFSRGKFYPIYRAESKGLALNPVCNNSFQHFNDILFNSYGDKYMDCKSSQMFKLLLSDNEIRFYRDQHLANILKNKKQFIRSIERTNERNQRVMLHSDQSRRIYNLEKIKQVEIVESLLTIAEEYINYTHVYGTYDTDKREITFLLDAFTPIKVAYKNKFIAAEPIFGIEFDQKLKLNYNYRKIKISEDNFKPKQLVFINALTHDTIKKHIHFNKINSKDSPETRSTQQMLKDNKIQYKITGKKLSIIPNSYSITSNVLIESKYDLTIPKGVTFKIGSGINFIVKGNSTISGTKETPVTIQNLTLNSPFGCFSIIGTNRRSEVKIDHLNVSGGSESMYQGRMYTGQFNVFHSDVTITNSTFSSSMGDDGLNIKFSKVVLSNCKSTNNKADQIDLDFCVTKITNCQFTSSGEDINGDGIDMSGTRGDISKCSFNGFLDKSVSLGEKSKVLVHDCTFSNNAIALAVKDQTVLYSWRNIFKNNQVDFYSFIKKGIFKEPLLYVNENKKTLKLKLCKKENLLFLNKKRIDFERNKLNASFKKFTI
jgi:hypothetical protein